MTLARNGLAVTRPNATLDTPLAAALLLRARSLARHMGDLDSIRANNQIGSLSLFLFRSLVMQPEETSFFCVRFFSTSSKRNLKSSKRASCAERKLAKVRMGVRQEINWRLVAMREMPITLSKPFKRSHRRKRFIHRG
jgi:hypothetical protein